MEGKRAISKANIHQLFATSVTCSFTSHNNEPTSNPLVPTILINHQSFQIAMFDCVNDILMLSEPFSLVHICRNQKTLSPSAILLLWVAANHRYIVCG